MRYEERRRIRRLYNRAAVANGLAFATALVGYDRMVKSLTGKGSPPPTYPFLVRLWAGHAALWGVTFARVARDPESNLPLVRYSWAEKLLTTVIVLQAVLAGRAPRRMVPFVIATDAVWIPYFVQAWLQIVADERGDPPPPTWGEMLHTLGEDAFALGRATSPGDD